MDRKYQLSGSGGIGGGEVKVGDKIYACNCGDGCSCKTMSRNAGNCICGKEMKEVH